MKTIACYSMNERVIGNFLGYDSRWRDSNITLSVAGKEFNFHAKCHSCNTRFSFNPGRLRNFYNIKKITCPLCGAVHTQENTIYTPIGNRYIPCGIILKLIKFKDKIEMRIDYCSYKLNEYGWLWSKEIFVFNLKENQVIWKKKDWRNSHWEEKSLPIGYLNDFYVLEEESVIYLLRHNYKNEGDSLKTILHKLVDFINGYMMNKGYHKQRFLFRGDKYYSFGGNILNIAHRLRFSTSRIFSELGNIKCNTWLACTRRIEDLWERDVEKIQEETKLPYLDCLLKHFNLPMKNFIRQNFKFKNIKMLQALFQKLPYDEAVSIYNIVINCKDYCDIDNFCKAYCSFKRLYPNLTAKRLWQMKYWKDTYKMYQDSDKKTLKEIYVKKVKLNELHDFLVPRYNMNKIKQRCLNVPHDIIRKMEMQLDFYKIRVVNFSRDLYYAGTTLNNCARTYENQIGANLQLVTIADDKGKLLALLEIKNSCIVQAKLKNNRAVYLNAEVNQKVIEFAEKLYLKIKTNDVKIEEKEKKKIA